jgi:hypothetical protein
VVSVHLYGRDVEDDLQLPNAIPMKL